MSRGAASRRDYRPRARSSSFPRRPAFLPRKSTGCLCLRLASASKVNYWVRRCSTRRLLCLTCSSRCRFKRLADNSIPTAPARLSRFVANCLLPQTREWGSVIYNRRKAVLGGFICNLKITGFSFRELVYDFDSNSSFISLFRVFKDSVCNHKF